MTHPETHDEPPTIAARGAGRPKSRPDDDGPGAPARRRRRVGTMGLAILLVLGGLSLTLMIAPAGLVVIAVGLVVGLWGALGGDSNGAIPRAPSR